MILQCIFQKRLLKFIKKICKVNEFDFDNFSLILLQFQNC